MIDQTVAKRLVALQEEVDRLRREMRRHLPILEECERDTLLWAAITAGHGIATLNGYRAALAEHDE